MADVLDEAFLDDFYKEHCCVHGGVLYVAFLADERRDWTYLFGYEIPREDLIATCIRDRAK